MTTYRSTTLLLAAGLALSPLYPSVAHAQDFSVNCGSGRTAVVRQFNGSTRVNCVTSEQSVQRRYAASPRRRTWQKSALMIGGAAATGAGIGGLVAGKKGALIGTAIGGGSASIYESSRRR